MKLNDDEEQLIKTVRSLDTAKVTAVIHDQKIRNIKVDIDVDLTKKVTAEEGVSRGTETVRTVE